MTRRAWICLAALGGACRPSAPLDVFPESVGGVWRRTAMQNLPVSDAPDPVPRSGVRRFETASYEGPGKLEARAYELNSPGIGVDLVQRWRPSADTVFFNPGSFFVVVKWREADRKALQAFVREMERRLEPEGARKAPL